MLLQRRKSQYHLVFLNTLPIIIKLQVIKLNQKSIYNSLFNTMSRLSAALSSATQHAMPPEFGRKWGTKCLNTRFPLRTLLCAGYSVKLILFKSVYNFLFNTIGKTSLHKGKLYFTKLLIVCIQTIQTVT